ncbi:MAG: TauD/TfdA dioxygenase family protein [Alphaproteobacteria bacterium]
MVALANLDMRPLSPSIGVEIHGVDLSTDLDDSLIAALRAAWLEHQMIFFRDQTLLPRDLLALAHHFGTPDEYPFVSGLPDFPLVLPIVKEADETSNFGGLWHSDTTYLDCPPMATMLYAVETPPVGGDTLFANQVMAYEALSDGLKAMLDGVRAVNVANTPAAIATRADMNRERGSGADIDARSSVHPVVRTHPETGQKSLYVNIAHSIRFENMTEAESASLLSYLFQHQIKSEFVCRFAWQPGSLAFWDNRACQHFPINDYHGYRRMMQRVIIAGDKPF